MELFSVACITCRAKIKVRHVSAVGQILACPRCGAMVQIEPPAGWTPPPEAAAPPAAAARAKQAPVPGKPAPAGKPATDQAPAGEAPPYVAQPVDDEFAPPALVTPQEQRARRLIYLCGGVAAAAVLLFGLWSTLGGPDDDEPPQAAATGTPAATTGSPPPLPRGTGTPASAVSPSSSAAPSVPAATASAPLPAAATPPLVAGATPTRPSILALAAPSPAATAAPSVSPAPGATAAMVAALPSPTAAAPPAPAPTSSRPAAPPMPQPPQAFEAADTSNRLDRPAGGLRFSQTTRRAALEVVAQLAGLTLDFDWDGLAPADAGLAEKIEIASPEGGTLRSLLEQMLAPRKLRWSAAGAVLVVRGPAEEERPTKVAYAVGDLTAGDAAQTSALGTLVTLLIAPPTWTAAGGSGTLQAGVDTLDVSQTPAVQREIAMLLDRLRLARGKSPLAAGAALATRFAAARETLDKQVTMNFRPAAPLRTVLARLEAAAGATITLDAGALSAEGAGPETRVGVAAAGSPLAAVLTALCEPRGWAWRIVDPHTIELTTRDALRRRGYVELYDLRPLLVDGARAEPHLARWKQQTAEAGWIESGGPGVMIFDAASGHVVVRQHQLGHERLAELIGDAIASQTPAPSAAATRPPAAVPSATAPSPRPPAATTPPPAGTTP